MSTSNAEVGEKILEDIDNIYTILVKNRICKRNDIFFCYLCKSNIQSLLSALYHAVSDREHKQRNKMSMISHEMIRCSTLDEEKSIDLVFNGLVIVSPPEYFCNLCLYELYSIESVAEHIKDSNHVTAKREKNFVIPSPSILTSSNCNNISNAKKKTESSVNCDNKSEENIKNIDSSNNSFTSTVITNNNSDSSNKKTENRVSWDNKSKENIKNIYSIPSTSNCDLSNNDCAENLCNSNEISKFFENKPMTVYACALCNVNITMNNKEKYHRMFHVSGNYSCENLDIVKFHFNSKDDKYIHCIVCDIKTRDVIELQNHLKNKKHKSKVSILKRTPEFRSYSKQTVTVSLDKLSAKRYINHSSLSKTIKEISFYCQLCEVAVPYSENFEEYKIHSRRSSHQEKLKDLYKKENDLKLKSIIEDLPNFKCFLCDIEFAEESSLWLHYKSDSHSLFMTAIDIVVQDNNVIFSLNPKNTIILHCTVCAIELNDLRTALGHINFDTHKRKCISTSGNKEINLHHSTNLDNNCTNIDSIPKELYEKQDKVQIEQDNGLKNSIAYFCPVCSINLQRDFNMIEHLQSKEHYQKAIRTWSRKYVCSNCNVVFDDDILFLNHLLSKHQEKNDNASSQSSDNNIESNNTYTNQSINNKNLIDDSELYVNTLKAESVNSEKMDEILHDLISFEPTEKVNLETNDSTVCLKELSILGKEYISLCIEPGRENIFSVNLDKLRTLQLSISLTFPAGSGRFCIPCSEEIPADSELFDKHLYNEKHLQNLKLLDKKHRSSKKCLKDEITDFDLAKSYMQGTLVDSDYSIMCFACNVKVEHYDSENHVNLQSHINNVSLWKKSAEDLFEEKKIVFCEAWYYAEKFLCDLCSLKFYSDITFANHLLTEEHLRRVRSAEYNNTKVEYNICGYCMTFWFGEANGYPTHCEGDFHKYLLLNGSYTISKFTSAVKDILDNHEKIIGELLSLNVNADSKSIDIDILRSIKALAQIYYPYAEVFKYGSRMSLTSLNESDLDVYVDCVSSYSSVMSAESSRKYLKNLWESLKQFEDTWIAQDILLNATVPIIRLRHRKTNLSCDISCSNGLVVEKSNLIRCYVEAFLPCKKLVLFLKKWMHLCRLSGAQGINSFATTCLVIYYLQIRGILPSVHTLIKLENNSNIIAGWETGFCKDISSHMSSEIVQPLLNIKDDESIKTLDHPVRYLLVGLFSFYSNFNYITDVICPFLGKIVKKKQFTTIDLLPEEMENYTNMYQNGGAKMFSFDSPMCVQDPLDLSKNVTKRITKLQLRTFKQYCYDSILLLKSDPKSFRFF